MPPNSLMERSGNELLSDPLDVELAVGVINADHSAFSDPELFSEPT